jgi:hypothetical protein
VAYGWQRGLSLGLILGALAEMHGLGEPAVVLGLAVLVVLAVWEWLARF